MDAEKFNIVFDGALCAGVTLDEAKANVAKLYGSNQEHVASLLFSGKRSILKRDLSEEKADKILAVLKSAGLLAMKEAVVPAFSLQMEEIKPSNEQPEKAEAGDKGASPGEGWMGAAAAAPAAATAMGASGRGNEMAATARPQSYASAQNSAPDTANYTEEFAELTLFSFEGRLGRLRYFVWPMIPGLIIMVVIMFGVALPMLDSVAEDGSFANVGKMRVLALLGLLLPLFIFGISVTVRRLHDLNLSGWWVLGIFLIGLIPFIGPLVSILAVLAYLFWPGSAGENNYGLPPPPNPNSLFTVIIVVLVLSVVLGGYVGYSAADKLAPLAQKKNIEMLQKQVDKAGENMSAEDREKLQQMIENMQRMSKDRQR